MVVSFRFSALGRSCSLALAILAGAFALLGTARPARGNDLDLFGLGAREISLGGAMTAYSNEFAATYYNPAGLMNGRHLALSTGYSFADYALDFDSQRGGTLDDDATRIRDLAGISFGLSTTLAPGDPDAKFAVGFALFLPVKRALDISESTASEVPEFVLYGGGRDRLAIYLGGAFRPFPWLSIGAGATLFADSDGENVNNILVGADRIEFEQDASHDAAPVIGVLLEPWEFLSFGVTYRGELSTKIEFRSITNDLADITFESITLFSPHQVAIGAAFDATARLTFVLDVTWYNWSAFKDAFIVAEANGLLVGNRVDSGFDDIIVPRVGVEFEALPWLLLRFGYFYQPSPAPEQDGFTNLIDNDKHVLSIGVGFQYDTDPLLRSSRPAGVGTAEATHDGPHENDRAIFPRGRSGVDFGPERMPALRKWPILSLDMFFQYHFLAPRDHGKIDPADPIGDSDSGGSILNFGLQLTLRF